MKEKVAILGIQKSVLCTCKFENFQPVAWKSNYSNKQLIVKLWTLAYTNKMQRVEGGIHLPILPNLDRGILIIIPVRHIYLQGPEVFQNNFDSL